MQKPSLLFKKKKENTAEELPVKVIVEMWSEIIQTFKCTRHYYHKFLFHLLFFSRRFSEGNQTLSINLSNTLKTGVS